MGVSLKPGAPNYDTCHSRHRKQRADAATIEGGDRAGLFGLDDSRPSKGRLRLMTRVILQGQLKHFGLLNALQLLCNASLTGAMRIYEYGLTFTIYLDRGYLVSAASPEQEPLGIKLLRKKRITPQQLDRALELQLLAERRGQQLPIGRILIHQKMVTQKDLEECVFDQIIETICLSMELPNAYFSFARLDVIHPAKFRAFVSFQFALLEAFRIADEIRQDRAFDPAIGASFDASSRRSQ